VEGLKAKTEGPVSRYINRRVSSRITGFIVSHGISITPNQMSLIAFATALAAAALIARGELLLGGLLVQLSSILDGVDGELARALKLASRRGAFLDTMLDRYADIMVFASIIYYLTGSDVDRGLVALLGFAAVTGDIMVSYLHARGQMDLGVHPAAVGPLDSLASRDVRLLLVAILVAVGRPLWALAAVAALAHTYTAVKFVYLTTRYRGAG
jgi:CDP-L-myo-inositol myo-inositolphosphotransferase